LIPWPRSELENDGERTRRLSRKGGKVK